MENVGSIFVNFLIVREQEMVNCLLFMENVGSIFVHFLIVREQAMVNCLWQMLKDAVIFNRDVETQKVTARLSVSIRLPGANVAGQRSRVGNISTTG